MKDLYQLVQLRGLGYVVAFLSQDVISVSRGDDIQLLIVISITLSSSSSSSIRHL